MSFYQDWSRPAPAQRPAGSRRPNRFRTSGEASPPTGAGSSSKSEVVVEKFTLCQNKSNDETKRCAYRLLPEQKLKPKATKMCKGKRRDRPSLRQQLAAIGAKAQSITRSIRKAHGLQDCSTVLFRTPAVGFVVGRLESKLPSPVEFHHNRCVYSFHHPFQRKTIEMTMFYAHMANAGLRHSSVFGHCLEFKILAPLKQYGIDYDPGKREHLVRIIFASSSDAKKVKEEIIPRIR